MSEISPNEEHRPVGHGLVATPPSPSLSLPLNGGGSEGTRPPIPSNVAKCGSFFERHPDAVPRRTTALSKTDLFAASRLYPMDAAPSSPPPRRGREREGGMPHDAKPETLLTHDHAIGSARSAPTHDHEIAAARIPPAGAARA